MAPEQDDLARRIAGRIAEATDIDRDVWRTETTAMAEIIRAELAPLLAAVDAVLEDADTVSLRNLRAARRGRA